MASTSGSYDPAETPTLLTADELSRFGPLLPDDAVLMGGVRVSDKAEHPRPGHPSVIVVFPLPDHTIHAVTITEVSPGHFEITDDHVTGTW